MLHPYGPRSSSVYWRRRVVLLASVVVVVALIVLTARALFAGAGSSSAAAGTGAVSTPGTTPRTPAPTHAARSPSTPRTSATASAHAAKAVPTCGRAQLKVGAVTDKASYPVGGEPVLMLQVANTASSPCVQDLADLKVVLRVYNGESRVWGSHDCKILPGSDDHTLMPSAPVRVSVVWSGLSSQPNCAGTRQRVGAGTYTLYVNLAGKDGSAAQFSIR